MAITKITTEVIEDGAITSAKLGSGSISASSLSGITTDNVSEGSTNVYYTDTRARGSISVTGGNLSYDSGTGVIQLTTDTIRGAISVTDAGGDGSLAYSAGVITYTGPSAAEVQAHFSATDAGGDGSFSYSNGVFTYTGPSASEVRAHFSAGTGIGISSGQISIGQDVSTTATPTFGNITTTGYIAGPATFTIDPAAVGDNTGTVVIAGNLQVDGTTTTINSTTVNIDDLNIQLATGAINAAAANGAGITVDGASATITYDGTNDEWDFNKDINVTGTITASGEIAANGGIALGDGDIATFGNSDDLKIYHVANSSSYIENFSGNLIIRNQNDNNDILIQTDDGAGGYATYIQADGSNGEVRLYHYGSEKFNTSSAGVEVTGTVTSDGLTVDGNTKLNGSLTVNGNVDTSASLGEVLQLSQTDSVGGFLWSVDRATNTYKNMTYHANVHKFLLNPTDEAMRINASGNVGVKDDDPLSIFTVRTDNAGGRGGELSILNRATATVGNEAALNFGLNPSTYNADLCDAQIKATLNNTNSATDMTFSTYDGANFASRMIISSDGQVGIGTDDPEERLHVLGQAVFDNIGNTNRGNIILGAHGNGTEKWATVVGTHYNEATGSGNGSGNAGVIMIGSQSISSANRVWIGHGPYELNPATEIRLGTYSATTHNLGGNTRMTIASDGYISMTNSRSEYGLELSSASGRSGLVLKKPGTSSIMGSALLLASDETYRLGTAGYYHIKMDQSGNTYFGDTTNNSYFNSSGNLLVEQAGGIFFKSASSYDTVYGVTNYVSQGYAGATQHYWHHLYSRGGTHITINTDGGVNANENSFDDFVIWQGIQDSGEPLFRVSNRGRVIAKQNYEIGDHKTNREEFGVNAINTIDEATSDINTTVTNTYENRAGVYWLNFNNKKFRAFVQPQWLQGRNWVLAAKFFHFSDMPSGSSLWTNDTSWNGGDFDLNNGHFSKYGKVWRYFGFTRLAMQMGNRIAPIMQFNSTQTLYGAFSGGRAANGGGVTANSTDPQLGNSTTYHGMSNYMGPNFTNLSGSEDIMQSYGLNKWANSSLNGTSANNHGSANGNNNVTEGFQLTVEDAHPHLQAVDSVGVAGAWIGCPLDEGGFTFGSASSNGGADSGFGFGMGCGNNARTSTSGIAEWGKGNEVANYLPAYIWLSVD